MFNKLKQVKDMRDQAKTLQNALGEEKISVSHKGCTMEMDGNQKILGLDISQDLLSADKKAKLEDAVIELHASALKKVQKVMMAKMKEQGGFDFPGM